MAGHRPFKELREQTMLINDLAKAIYESEYDGEEYPWDTRDEDERNTYVVMAKAALKSIGQKLTKIAEILGATDETFEHSAYYNLEGAIIDLEREKADKICIDTLRRVQGQVSEVMKLVEIKHEVM